MSVHGDHYARDDSFYLELNGLLYRLCETEIPPVGDDGLTHPIVFDHDERIITVLVSMTGAERARQIAREMGHDPRNVTWRLVPVDERQWRHVPMATLTD